MTASELDIPAIDGFSLGARVFEPPGSARATVIVNGGTAIPQRFYARCAAALAAEGLRVVTYDYRGVGASRPRSLRGFAATMLDWARLDARGALRWTRARFADRPVSLLAHSFGGQLLGLVDDFHDLPGAVMVGAQLGYVGHWPQPARARINAIWRLAVPALTATLGYYPGQAFIGEDLPAGVAREWARWCTHPGYLAGEHPDAPARFARFRRPVRFYSFTDDDFAPEAAVRHYLALLSGAPVDHRRLAPSDVGLRSVGHFGFFRQGAEALWREAAAALHDFTGRGETDRAVSAA
jgi:predicted alpha/beta hydrolase